MQSAPIFNIRHKLILSHTGVAIAATLATEGALVLVHKPLTAGAALLTLAIAGITGLGLGIWSSYRLSQRVRHTLDISQAWLRGNLNLRIDNTDMQSRHIYDDLSLLDTQLNLLAEQLQEDEQDLEELRERNSRLSDQVRALAVVEERNRLARELHDSVKQHLFSLAMTASALRAHFDQMKSPPADLAEMVQEIESAAQNAQRETTRLIEDLRPGSLQEQGLIQALSDYTLLFGAREHLLVYLDAPEGEQARADKALSPTVAETLYRVAQEALHNVARHAHATRVDVRLHILPERATLTVEDNGTGFDMVTASKGLGMTNMQERVMAVGGRLSVKSEIGIGTTLTAEIGLSQPGGLQPSMGTIIENRPRPTYDNWAWLGQKLVIPVGQTWPWLPADQLYLHDPLVEPREQALRVKRTRGFLQIGRGYVLQFDQQLKPLVRFHHNRNGYEWKCNDGFWSLHTVRGLSGQMVLTRNQQALAALQYQGRQMDNWTEIVYDNHGYRLSHSKEQIWAFMLTDEQDATLLRAEGPGLPKITLQRPLPLPLLVSVTAHILDELATIVPDTAG
ncbi:MAG: hypothetical protein JXA21_30325 [Anaerolineae bacterium]|nr:hypothetical protein [Anaerolineae bacterium]